jgi:predicted Zn-dependent protease
MKKIILSIALCACLAAPLLLAAGCGRVLLTDRQQFIIVSDSDMRALGQQQYAEILSQSKVITGGTDHQRVLRVGGRLAAAVNDFAKTQGLEEYASSYKWEFNLIDDKAVNAFCLPGGKIAVYSGLLPVTKDDAGLAVVMAHEIAHALAKHGEERISQILLVQYGGAKLSEALSSQPEETRNNVMLAFGIGANVGVILPYSRMHEYEADRIGLALMAYAGYDPNEALNFWDRMEKLGGSGSMPEFLSTHPLSSDRINAIKAEIPEAMKFYRP